MRRFLKKTIIIIAIAALMCGAVVWWWRAQDNPRLSFRTAIVKRGDVAATISASGTIEPVEVVDIGAQVAGIIKSFGTDINDKTIDYGSVVESNAVLAKIDDSVYAANLLVAKANESAAEANLQQMQAKLDQAAAEWKRAEDLLANKLMAQVDYDTDKANYEVAKANVSVAESGIAQAQAAVTAAQRDLDFCTIKSPVEGVVVDRRVNIGQTVVSSLNTPSLFLIAGDLTKMQIWAAVNEADVGRIKPGAPVAFAVDAFPDRQFQGVVGKVRLNATMTQNVVLYTVEINVDNPDKLLLPYLTANVHFQLSRETNALLVPNAALRWAPSSLAEVAPDARSGPLIDPPDSPDSGAQKDSHRTLWIKSGELVRPVEVTAGISDGTNTTVTADGLREGDEVVTSEIFESQNDMKNPFLPRFIRR